jgi:hypothetical protein
LEAYYSCDAPEGSNAAGDDIGTLEALEELGVATEWRPSVLALVFLTTSVLDTLPH